MTMAMIDRSVDSISILRVDVCKTKIYGDKEICFGVGVLCCFIWFV